MSKVLVTGATGFIGQHIVSEFSAAGHEVSCLVRSTSKLDNLPASGIALHRTDILDPDGVNEAVAGQDIVIHLAGLTKAFRSTRLFDVNQYGTKNVANACSQQPNPPTLIYISSMAAAGPVLADKGRVENDPLIQVSNYGKSKFAGENELKRLADKVPISILRPGIVLGEGDKDGFEIFKGAAMGFIIIPSLVDRIFSVIHARDLAQAITLTVDCGERLDGSLDKGVYFASGREEWTFAELGQRIGELLGKKRVRPIYNPNFAIWTAGAIYEVISRIRKQAYIMSLDKAREATAGAWHCDPGKLLRLGFNPQPLEQRLSETIDWYLEKGWLKSSAKIDPPHFKQALDPVQRYKTR